MHLGVQGLDAAVEHFRELRHLSHFGHGQLSKGVGGVIAQVGVGRQHIGNMIRQDPSGHGITKAVKTAILPARNRAADSGQQPDHQQTGQNAAKPKEADLAVVQLQQLREHALPATG